MSVLLAPLDMRPVYIGAGIALIINSFFVVLQVLGYDPIAQAVPPAGIFMNKGAGAEITAMVMVGCSGSFLVVRAAPFLLGAVPLFAPPISRAPLVALGLVCLLTFWRHYRFLGLIAAILLVGLLVGLVLMPGRAVHGGLRIGLWTSAVFELSWFGHGLGGFFHRFPWFEYAHNDLLQVLFELGVPGALLFVAFFGYCLWRGPLVERAVLVVFLVEGLFGFPLYTPATAFVAALAAGSIIRARCELRGCDSAGKRVCDASAQSLSGSASCDRALHFGR